MGRTASVEKEARDLGIFDRFVEKCPDFAGAPICTRRHSGLQEPPDIVCKDAFGNQIGVELTECINKERYGTSHGLKRLLRPKPGWNILLWCNGEPYGHGQRAAVRREFEQLISCRIGAATPLNDVLTFEVARADIEALAPSMVGFCYGIQGVQGSEGEVSEGKVVVFSYYSPSSHLGPAKLSIEEQLKQKLLKDSYRGLKTRLGLNKLFLVLHHDSEARKGVPVSPELLVVCRNVVAELGPGQFDGIFLFADVRVVRDLFMRCDRVYP